VRCETRGIERAQPHRNPAHEDPAQPTRITPPQGSGFVAARAAATRGMAGLQPAGVIALQRAVGNRGLARLLRAARTADTSPPPELDVGELEPSTSGGEPISDGGVLAEMDADERVESRPLQRVARGARRRWLMRYSGSAAAAYARTWATGTNSSYPRFGNDCTNFVSQSVLAGGWSMVGGSCSDRKDNDVWWYGESKCWYPSVRASYTWAAAQNFANFMVKSGRGKNAARVSDLDIGDILQMKFAGDSNIHHTMIVTDKKSGDIFLSYHTSDHLDEPFWAAGGILDRYPTATYYAWKL
jgi:hypothetical protein